MANETVGPPNESKSTLVQPNAVPDEGWQRSLAAAIRAPAELIERLQLSPELIEPAEQATQLFGLMCPESYLARMVAGDPRDPLLLQVLPIAAEHDEVAGFAHDAVEDHRFRVTPGLLQKYEGRALLIATGACAVHCRYCFRREYPYGQEPRRLEDWEPAFAAIEADESLREILLSGGDPLMLTDARLELLCQRLEQIPHVTRLRFHTRLPIVLPNRVTSRFLRLLTDSRLRSIVVVHANHPHEVAADCASALRRLVEAGITVLNQSVLLRGINDSIDVLEELSQRLVDLGVIPYYLHQLDRVSGTAHFEVAPEVGKQLVRQLRQRLPGYAVPQYVREIPGEPFKTPLA